MGSNDSKTKEKIEQYRKFIEEREKKLRELQAKFEEVIPKVIELPTSEDNIPEIVESLDGEIKPENKSTKLIDRKFFWIAAAIILAVLPLIKFSCTLQSYGEVVPEKRVIIRAPFDGVIVQLYSHEGHQVKQGQTIGRIRAYNLDDELSNKREELSILDQQISIMKERNARLKNISFKLKEMMDGNNASLFEYDTIQSNYEIAQLKYSELRREKIHLQDQIAALEVKNEWSKLIAPFAGTVVTHNLTDQKDTYFEKGEKICEVIRLGKAYIETTVAEGQLKNLSYGQLALIKFPGDKKVYRGQVVSIAEMSARSPLTLEEMLQKSSMKKDKGIIIKIILKTKPKNIKYGLSAKVKIIGPYKNLIERLID